MMTKQDVLNLFKDYKNDISKIEEINRSYQSQIDAINAQIDGNERIISVKRKQLENKICDYGKQIFPYKKGMEIKIQLTDYDGPSKEFKDANCVNYRNITKVNYYMDANYEIICRIYLTKSKKLRSFNGTYYAVDVTSMLLVSESNMYNDTTNKRPDCCNLYNYSINVEIVK